MSNLIKSVVGYEGFYEVDSYGFIYGVERVVKKWDGERRLKRSLKAQLLSKQGYLMVTLSKNGITKKYSVHRLVATAFLFKKNGATDVNHIDGNKQNNNVSNLEWVTKSENCLHSIHVLGNKPSNFKIGTIWYKERNVLCPASKSVLMFNKKNEFIKEFDSLTDAGKFLGKHAAQILGYIQGKRNNKEYNFKYKNQ